MTNQEIRNKLRFWKNREMELLRLDESMYNARVWRGANDPNRIENSKEILKCKLKISKLEIIKLTTKGSSYT